MDATLAPKRERRRPSPAEIPVGNGILAALLATEYKRILPRLERVTLKRGEIVYRAEQKIDAVYFPEEAVIAMVDTTDDGRTVEVGVIGREGLVGINIFLGGAVTPDRAIVQLSGGAMRMKSKDLRKEMRFGSPLQRLLLAYTRTFLAVISQSVACSQHHTVEQRLTRWLLTMNDYAKSREFPMFQKSIADMLGVRRVSVTDAARKLQSAGLINYRRGGMRVLDKRGLERQSCECYRFIRRQYEGLHDELPELLSPR
ncbi:MAG TPA: Crp/Fnr family transcriptional regulator [Burkholderiales bacterium]|nr:Crp/Fnr family transcriptional regulator [Burkholderiales bacterium]